MTFSRGAVVSVRIVDDGIRRGVEEQREEAPSLGAAKAREEENWREEASRKGEAREASEMVREMGRKDTILAV